MSATIRALTAALILLTTSSGAAAEEHRERARADEMVTGEAQAAIDRGLRFLARRQHTDGSFGRGGYSQTVAICALAGMAILSGGSTPGRGPYGAQVDRCIEFILNSSQESGLIEARGSNDGRPMYGHGFATLFLAETYGMSTKPEIRARLAKAVDLIVNAQNQEGGWRYQPVPNEADISVTVCQVMALRAARNAGIFVPRDTIDRCVAYVKKCQNSDGGFMYTLGGGQSAFPRSAAGVVALYSAGIYNGPEMKKTLNYLLGHMPNRDLIGYNREMHYFYGHYYAAQAMWHAGDKYWREWYPAIRDELLARQRVDDGAWPDPICEEYGTAMACLILQMPNDYLPIFQR